MTLLPAGEVGLNVSDDLYVAGATFPLFNGMRTVQISPLASPPALRSITL
jgi:hypothetical protein